MVRKPVSSPSCARAPNLGLASLSSLRHAGTLRYALAELLSQRMLTMGFDPHRFAERDRKDRDQKRRDRAEAKRQRRMQRVAGEDIDSIQLHLRKSDPCRVRRSN